MNKLAICVPVSRDLSFVRNLIASIDAQKGEQLSQIDICLIIAFNQAESLSNSHAELIDLSACYNTKFIYEERVGYVYIRNALVNEALRQNMDGVIFIDDDEQATQGWLNALIAAWAMDKNNVVTGPVKGVLPKDAPKWAKRSRIFDTWKMHPSGSIVKKAYTNNVLIHSDVFRSVMPPFDPLFNIIGSEDVHFSRQTLQKGYKIIWSNEAIVEELIPYDRLNMKWLTSRYYRNGLGDSLSVLKTYPFLVALLRILFLSCARFVCGVFLMVFGAIFVNYRFMIRGYTRVCSSVGSSIVSVAMQRKVDVL